MIWTVLGISVAIIAVFCVSVAETLVGRPIFESQRLHIAVALAAVGVLMFLLGRLFNSGRRAKAEDDKRPFILFDLRFWGPMLIIFGVITLFIRPLRQMKAEMAVVLPKPAAKQPVAVVSIKPIVQKAVVFPKVRIQGIFFREFRAAAILNGESYFIGDHVGNAVIKAIDRNSVLLEIAGETKLLTLN